MSRTTDTEEVPVLVIHLIRKKNRLRKNIKKKYTDYRERFVSKFETEKTPQVTFTKVEEESLEG